MIRFLMLQAPLLAAISCFSQKTNGKLSFQQGQQLQIIHDVKKTIAQDAMGQAIDFSVDGSAKHIYKVTNTTGDNSTLHHEAKSIKFSFEGMGQKRPFDSDNEKDIAGPLGKPIKETLAKTYDMIVDPMGKVMLVRPETFAPAEMDERTKLISNMLEDILVVVQPPAKGTNSFFKVLPDNEVGQGDSWTETYENGEGKFNNTYTLSEITDSTIVVDLSGNSATSSKLEIMAGMELITTLSNRVTGKIILDRSTGLVRMKTIITDSNGTTKGMGNETPITSKTVITTTVTPIL